MKMQKDVAIIFDDLTEFLVMRCAVDAMLQAGTTVDIIVPYDSGYADLPTHTIQEIRNAGYEALDDADPDNYYKILLTPYPGIKVVERLNFSYHILYMYGLLTTKPDPVFNPNQKLEYDAAILFNTYEKTIYTAYGISCHVVPYWRKIGTKKDVLASGKRTLLILPTFGDISCIDLIDEQLLERVKEEYKVIVKAHHATDFKQAETERLNKLKRIADEFYSSDVSIMDLLGQADVVLSDNSAAIFESIYAGIPVAILSKDFNSRRLGQIDTFQQWMIEENLIAASNDPKDLKVIIDDADNYMSKQASLCEELFIKSDDPLSEFVKVIQIYKEKDPSKDLAKKAHMVLVDDYKRKEKEIAKLKKSLKKEKTNNLNKSLKKKIKKKIKKLLSAR